MNNAFPLKSAAWLQKILLALTLGVLLAGILLAGLSLGYRLAYLGRILPGVSVAGVDLSGLSREQAAARLAEALPYAVQGRIVLTDGNLAWTVRPLDVGLVIDTVSSAEAAYQVGRRGGLVGGLREALFLRRQPVDLPPVVIFNQAQAYAFLQNLAAQINVPPREASLRLNGALVEAENGRAGQALDIEASLAALGGQLLSLQDGLVTLQLTPLFPQVMDAETAAETARTLLAAPFVINLPAEAGDDVGPWQIPPETLAQWVLFPAREGAYHVVLNPALLQAYLNDIAAHIARDAENARFIFNDDTRELEVVRPAVSGRQMDLDASLAQIQQALDAGEHQAELAVSIQPPDVDEQATAASLGITELVSVQSSYFRGSSGDRIQNIQTAAAQFHGLLIPPGGTLSMADVLQDISLDNGYAEALIIYNGRTIKGVGGGVCQVSTTLFRTAFFGGYPVLERHAHAYRVYYYEQTQYGYDERLAGLDATVYIPVVDFKFKNDTPYWLLMETYVNVGARRLTWKFYSTSDGRSVTWDTTGLQNIVPAPEPVFVENPDLPPGKMRQVDWAADGADVTVTRQVRRGEALLFEDVFQTHYQPWAAVCEYASDVDNPEGSAKELGICQP